MPSSDKPEIIVFKTGNRYTGIGDYELYSDPQEARRHHGTPTGGARVIRVHKRNGTFPPDWKTGRCAYYVRRGRRRRPGPSSN